MTDMKTTKNDASVDGFLDGVKDEARQRDCRTVIDIMTRVTVEDAAMWGTSIVGFGNYHYKYDSGREGDYFLTGLAPRKTGPDRLYHAGLQQLRRFDGQTWQTQDRPILPLYQEARGRGS